MDLLPVKCPYCHDIEQILKVGITPNNKQRFLCQNPDCKHKTFIIDYDRNGYLVAKKRKLLKWPLTVVE